MPTNKQRREAARRHLERQLQNRQEREARRKRITMITSIAGSVVVVAAVVVAVVLIGGSDNDKKPAASSKSPSPTATTQATTSAPAPSPSTTPAPKATGPSVTFDGVTVGGAADLKGEPSIKSAGTKTPTKLEYKDLVVGKGKAAAPNASATVQYVGALYKNGQVFDASWAHGQAATFTLNTGPQGVIEGFATGIGGGKGVPPMKVGGRRLLIMPPSMGYGKTGSGTIPPNSTLVFVVDLTKLG